MSHELLDAPRRYALRSTGNLLAHTAYIGPLTMLYAAFRVRSAV